MKELLEEIQIASNRNPDLSILDLIEHVTNFKYSTRKMDSDYFRGSCSKFEDDFVRMTPKYHLTNYDILRAFKTYNKTK